MVVPPADLAPLQAASMTPPSPPQTMVTPRNASSLPTCSAKLSDVRAGGSLADYSDYQLSARSACGPVAP